VLEINKCDNILLSQVFIMVALQSEPYEPPSAIRMDRTKYERKMFKSCTDGSHNSYWCNNDWDGNF